MVMASRRDTLPSVGLTTSARVVTWIVAGVRRSSSVSRRGRHRGVRGFRPEWLVFPNTCLSSFFTFDSVLRMQPYVQGLSQAALGPRQSPPAPVTRPGGKATSVDAPPPESTAG